MDKKINIGLVGLGHLGKIHLKCIKMSPYVQLRGVWDLNKEVESKIAQEEAVPIYQSFDQFLESIDAVIIVSSTSSHYDIAKLCLTKNKHVFIEKPVTASFQECMALQKFLRPGVLKVQIGHVERFNPAYLAVKNNIGVPMFIEGHRLAEFKPRGTDVSVIMDLMIHDLDLVLSMVKYPIKDIRASGVSVMSSTPDICNTRLEFENGTVANLTASRISLKQMRKLRLFQQDQYISMDLLKKETQIVKISDTPPIEHPFSWTIDTNMGTKHVQVDMPVPLDNNAILDELNAFGLAILNNTEPPVSFEDGMMALDLAERIQNLILHR